MKPDNQNRKEVRVQGQKFDAIIINNDSEHRQNLIYQNIYCDKGAKYDLQILIAQSESINTVNLNIYSAQDSITNIYIGIIGDKKSHTNIECATYIQGRNAKCAVYHKTIALYDSKSYFKATSIIEQNSNQCYSDIQSSSLMLSNDAITESDPCLNIKYNDIDTCKHSAAIHSIEQDTITYMCSRGIEMKNCKEIYSKYYLINLYENIDAQINNHILNNAIIHD